MLIVVRILFLTLSMFSHVTSAKLVRARSQTLWARTQSLYDRLIVITLSTGLLTAITAGIALALFVHDSNSTVWYIPCVH